jgi:hypothetical protein
MKVIIPALALLSVFFTWCIAAPVSLKLNDGSVIKGEVAASRTGDATDLVVTTEYGVVRVPVAKLTQESKDSLGLGKPLTPEQYVAKIAALEERIKKLEEENASLRKDLTSGAARSASVPAPTRSLAPTAPEREPASPATAGSYTLSSTGKRHNARCRFYAGGKPCAATDGVRCKICGG